MTALELSRELKTPRGTIYRILQTLITKGFVYQHESDKHFRLQHRVKMLSIGFTDELLLANVAKPIMKNLTEQLLWPVSLAVISENDLVVLENTDHFSRLAVEKFSVGHRMPVLMSASGLCILAFNNENTRADQLLAIGNRQGLSHQELRSNMAAIRELGFAKSQRSRERVTITAISVPINSHEGKSMAALTLRYTEPAISWANLKSTVIPALLRTAEKISAEFSLKQSQNNNSQ